MPNQILKFSGSKANLIKLFMPLSIIDAQQDSLVLEGVKQRLTDIPRSQFIGSDEEYQAFAETMTAPDNPNLTKFFQGDFWGSTIVGAFEGSLLLALTNDNLLPQLFDPGIRQSLEISYKHDNNFRGLSLKSIKFPEGSRDNDELLDNIPWEDNDLSALNFWMLAINTDTVEHSENISIYCSTRIWSFLKIYWNNLPGYEHYLQDLGFTNGLPDDIPDYLELEGHPLSYGTMQQFDVFTDEISNSLGIDGDDHRFKPIIDLFTDDGAIVHEDIPLCGYLCQNKTPTKIFDGLTTLTSKEAEGNLRKLLLNRQKILTYTDYHEINNHQNIIEHCDDYITVQQEKLDEIMEYEQPVVSLQLEIARQIAMLNEVAQALSTAKTRDEIDRIKNQLNGINGVLRNTMDNYSIYLNSMQEHIASAPVSDILEEILDDAVYSYDEFQHQYEEEHERDENACLTAYLEYTQNKLTAIQRNINSCLALWNEKSPPINESLCQYDDVFTHVVTYFQSPTYEARRKLWTQLKPHIENQQESDITSLVNASWESLKLYELDSHFKIKKIDDLYDAYSNFKNKPSIRQKLRESIQHTETIIKTLEKLSGKRFEEIKQNLTNRLDTIFSQGITTDDLDAFNKQLKQLENLIVSLREGSRHTESIESDLRYLVENCFEEISQPFTKNLDALFAQEVTLDTVDTFIQQLKTLEISITSTYETIVSLNELEELDYDDHAFLRSQLVIATKSGKLDQGLKTIDDVIDAFIHWNTFAIQNLKESESNWHALLETQLWKLFDDEQLTGFFDNILQLEQISLGEVLNATADECNWNSTDLLASTLKILEVNDGYPPELIQDIILIMLGEEQNLALLWQTFWQKADEQLGIDISLEYDSQLILNSIRDDDNGAILSLLNQKAREVLSSQRYYRLMAESLIDIQPQHYSNEEMLNFLLATCDENHLKSIASHLITKATLELEEPIVFIKNQLTKGEEPLEQIWKSFLQKAVDSNERISSYQKNYKETFDKYLKNGDTQAYSEKQALLENIINKSFDISFLLSGDKSFTAIHSSMKMNKSLPQISNLLDNWHEIINNIFSHDWINDGLKGKFKALCKQIIENKHSDVYFQYFGVILDELRHINNTANNDTVKNYYLKKLFPELEAVLNSNQIPAKNLIDSPLVRFRSLLLAFNNDDFNDLLNDAFYQKHWSGHFNSALKQDKPHEKIVSELHAIKTKLLKFKNVTQTITLNETITQETDDLDYQLRFEHFKSSLLKLYLKGEISSRKITQRLNSYKEFYDKVFQVRSGINDFDGDNTQALKALFDYQCDQYLRNLVTSHTRWNDNLSEKCQNKIAELSQELINLGEAIEQLEENIQTIKNHSPHYAAMLEWQWQTIENKLLVNKRNFYVNRGNASNYQFDSLKPYQKIHVFIEQFVYDDPPNIRENIELANNLLNKINKHAEVITQANDAENADDYIKAHDPELAWNKENARVENGCHYYQIRLANEEIATEIDDDTTINLAKNGQLDYSFSSNVIGGCEINGHRKATGTPLSNIDSSRTSQEDRMTHFSLSPAYKNLSPTCRQQMLVNTLLKMDENYRDSGIISQQDKETSGATAILTNITKTENSLTIDYAGISDTEGLIVICNENGDNPRLFKLNDIQEINPQDFNEDEIEQDRSGMHRLRHPKGISSINMSNALGDNAYKSHYENFTAKPDFGSVRLEIKEQLDDDENYYEETLQEGQNLRTYVINPTDKVFILNACDGIRDHDNVLTDDHIKNLVSEHVNHEHDPGMLAQKIVMSAYTHGSTDNISCQVVNTNAMENGSVQSLALFDGHGSQQCAAFCQSHVGPEMNRQLLKQFSLDPLYLNEQAKNTLRALKGRIESRGNNWVNCPVFAKKAPGTNTAISNRQYEMLQAIKDAEHGKISWLQAQYQCRYYARKALSEPKSRTQSTLDLYNDVSNHLNTVEDIARNQVNRMEINLRKKLWHVKGATAFPTHVEKTLKKFEEIRKKPHKSYFFALQYAKNTMAKAARHNQGFFNSRHQDTQEYYQNAAKQYKLANFDGIANKIVERLLDKIQVENGWMPGSGRPDTVKMISKDLNKAKQLQQGAFEAITKSILKARKAAANPPIIGIRQRATQDFYDELGRGDFLSEQWLEIMLEEMCHDRVQFTELGLDNSLEQFGWENVFNALGLEENIDFEDNGAIRGNLLQLEGINEDDLPEGEDFNIPTVINEHLSRQDQLKLLKGYLRSQETPDPMGDFCLNTLHPRYSDNLLTARAG